MVTLASLTKFHSFKLAEQLNRLGVLNSFHTLFAGQKNKILRYVSSRNDVEQIDPALITTYPYLAAGMRIMRGTDYWKKAFVSHVARRVSLDRSAVFIGWSGISLEIIRSIRDSKKTIILERGSAHILKQNDLLRLEYGQRGLSNSIRDDVIETELREYELADYISIPSKFCFDSFKEYGVSPSKLFLNPYGVSEHFKLEDVRFRRGDHLNIIFVGNVTFQKGIYYLLEVVRELIEAGLKLKLNVIGHIPKDMQSFIESYKRIPEIEFLGFQSHDALIPLFRKADLGLAPSIQDGFGMVVTQMMRAGIPVIVSDQTGASDVIDDGVNGIIVRAGSISDLRSKIQLVYDNIELNNEMKRNLLEKKHRSWNDYGDNYFGLIKNLLQV